jgi:S-DNA-T family DNA segregation ATPase FtsK/SpoIIIE
VHGPFVDDKEVEKITTFLKAQGAPSYIETITIDEDDEGSEYGEELGGSGDENYDQAVKIVLRDRKASTSYIQRCLRIGYNRAAIIIERMEKEGIVSPPNHVGKRDILLGNGE